MAVIHVCQQCCQPAGPFRFAHLVSNHPPLASWLCTACQLACSINMTPSPTVDWRLPMLNHNLGCVTLVVRCHSFTCMHACTDPTPPSPPPPPPHPKGRDMNVQEGFCKHPAWVASCHVGFLLLDSLLTLTRAQLVCDTLLAWTKMTVSQQCTR